MESLKFENFVISEYTKTSEMLRDILGNNDFITNILSIANLCYSALQNGNKIMFCGNGGSAADSQHLAGELVSRFNFDRPGLAAVALTVDTSILTAIGNDYGYDKLFARQIEAIGRSGDILIGFSTSGKSANIVKAFESAKLKNITTVAMLGSNGNDVGKISDYCINIPSNKTPKIQEGHIMTGHILCGLIEEMIFGVK